MQKILIADDEAKIRRIIRDFLAAKGFETVEAEDGAQALRVFSENGDIALAVLDIMMPEMNGWEVCRKIRETSDVRSFSSRRAAKNLTSSNALSAARTIL